MIFKKVTTFFNFKDMFPCYEHHLGIYNQFRSRLLHASVILSWERIIFQLLCWFSANFLQHIILWLFIIDSKWGAFSPPLSKSHIRDKRLTLSFPFQMNLKSNLLTSITISFCTQIKLARYINIGITNVFTIWILPRIVKSLHFHICNFSLIDLRISSKFNFFLWLSLYVKYTPRILIRVHVFGGDDSCDCHERRRDYLKPCIQFSRNLFQDQNTYWTDQQYEKQPQEIGYFSERPRHHQQTFLI